MIRAAAALCARTCAAQADLPSPLFCIAVALCDTADTCTPHRSSPPFVLRATEGEWLMQVSPRGPDIRVHLAGSLTEARDTAPAGALIALVEAGTTAEGAIELREHGLRPGVISANFARHLCTTSAGAP